MVQTALEGITKAREQAAASSQRLAKGPVEAEDIVSLKLSEHAFKANAAVMGAAKRMQDRLLDIFA
ncbi:MAG: hypothetical protein QF384_03325 [Alphaproteobacteria bacterium]|jgi:hypothetical protein|nr:hypothetical protein [Alphaproteobacteria bacterium]MDP6831139.1 hypothetical protein [Alphaproteobacteria bacterium]MDP6875164.1 hypothetical protein [Alphaproteobacteria bacterium]